MPSSDNIDLMKPVSVNPTLITKLHQYDPCLLIYYDSAVAKYGIARTTQRGTMFVALWQGKKGEFLPLDDRMYDAIVSWDMRPNYRSNVPKDADELCDQMEAREEAYREKVDADFDDDIGHLTRSNRSQLNKALEKA